ncbi:uncharacterized protein RJT20DRAFT_125828 [Scheffersomyces xylosifermentans]|uniref:uncharacterized protein n=1 Tax=Scheffersomyces xylosifermentans TaxID=1304137 RepID=UPI00315DE592
MRRYDGNSDRVSMDEVKSRNIAELEDSDFDSDSDNENHIFPIKKKGNGRLEDRVDEDFDASETIDDDESDEESTHVLDGSGEEITAQHSIRDSKKLKRLSPEQIEKESKRIKKTGVCYLSRIPPYMKPATLRSILSRFGKIDRLFLKPEDSTIYHKRVKYGGNKKKNFTEGWVEFVRKKDAKMCASTLNANKLGGKKTSYYYDDVINMKYLSGFKWFDLTQQIAKENETRQARLTLELSQQQKLNKTFVNNVEKSKLVTNIQKKRKLKNPDLNTDTEIRRSFKQRKVTSARAEANEELKEKSRPNTKLNDVLSKVF